HMRTSPKFLSVLFVAGISFFFFSFVLQQNNGGGEIIPQNQANTTTGGGVFQPVKFQDRLYVNENTPSRRPISYNYLRQGDVSFEKRVWRRIDLREKLNQPLMYPYNAEETGGYQNRKSFFDILTGAILDSLNPIAFFKDDEFKDQVMSREAVKKELMKAADSVKITDVDGNDSINPATNSPYYRLLAAEPYTSKDALQFAIKEDWFFDKQRSVLDVRILGLGIFLDKEYNIAGEKIKRV
ncbi:MAG: gliding motility protein GldN, partial [Bacteroidota bacterium]